MKNTAVLIDTNVVLDWLLVRQPFADNAKRIIEYCINENWGCYLAGHTLLNIFYITRKEKSIEERKEILLMLCDCFKIINIEKHMFVTALQNENWRDLEDGLQMLSAEQENLDYIITRDLNDFKHTSVRVLSPESFLKIIRS
ncbi:MAG: PIN domain-containing protein [Oscillospiraceae bacterium]|nr:PIN domain-containing protein [Oscillospiraceae bacterium]